MASIAVLVTASALLQAPDVALVGGRVFTSDTARTWAEALAIRSERIVAVGTTAEIRRLAGPATRIIDVGGRVVTPGFNDAHDHIAAGSPGVAITMGGEGANPSGAEVLDSLRVTAARVASGTWIRADIWTRALDDTALRRASLDRVAPSDPVMLSSGWGHGVIVNSAAMRVLGIRDDEPDPLGGWYERDRHGRLTGRLDEYAGWSARRKYRGLLPDSAIIANLRQLARRDLQLGITSVQDMGLNLDPATQLRVLRAAQLPLRVHIYKHSIPNASSLNIAEWGGVPERLGPLVTISGRKWILDGTPLDGLMLTRRPQPPPAPPTWRGRFDFPVDSVRAMLAHALRTREQLAMHIVGDSAIVIVLSLMESLAPDSVWRQQRVRFEHGGVVGARDLWSRAVAKGIVIVGNLQLLPPPPILAMLPKPLVDEMASFLAPAVFAAFPMGLGSDGVARSPFIGMWQAMSLPGVTAASRERLVRAYTWGSAYAELAEKDKGTLAPGMLADVAVLSQDPFTVAVDALGKTESVMTLVGGRIVWDAGVLR